MPCLVCLDAACVCACLRTNVWVCVHVLMEARAGLRVLVLRYYQALLDQGAQGPSSVCLLTAVATGVHSHTEGYCAWLFYVGSGG